MRAIALLLSCLLLPACGETAGTPPPAGGTTEPPSTGLAPAERAPAEDVSDDAPAGETSAEAALVRATPRRAYPGVVGWSQWRGPFFDGSAEAEGLPTTWSETENVVWKTPLPGPSAATPVVGAGRVYLTAFAAEGQDLIALCIDRATGEIAWQRTVGKNDSPYPGEHARENSRAACSPVTDGERTCFLFGTGLLVAFDRDGEELWRRDLVEEYGPFDVNNGYASSPLLFQGTLVVQVVHRGDSYLLGVDPRTGENRWRHERPTEARAESREAYTTPVPFYNEGEVEGAGQGDDDGRWEILVLGGDCLTGHDAATGEELWRWCGLNPMNRPAFRAVNNTVVGEDGMVFVTSPQYSPMHGLRVRGTTVEEVWQLRRSSSDVPTPLYYRGRLYVVANRGRRVVCVDPSSGEIVWNGDFRFPSFVRASPTGADGKIYVIDAEANALVLAAGDELEVLGRVEMESYPTRSSIVVDGDQLLVRTADRLYCFGR